MREQSRKDWSKRVRFDEERSNKPKGSLRSKEVTSKVKKGAAKQAREDADEEQSSGKYQTELFEQLSDLTNSMSSSEISIEIFDTDSSPTPPPQNIEMKKKKKWKTNDVKKSTSVPKKPVHSLPVALKDQPTAAITKKPGPLVEQKKAQNPIQLPALRHVSMEEVRIPARSKGLEKIKNQPKRKSSWVNPSSSKNADTVADLDYVSSIMSFLSSPSSEKLFGIKSVSESDLINPGIAAVLERLERKRSDRLHNDFQDELNAIRQRVNKALKNVDFMFEDENEDKQSQFTLFYDATQKRSELEHQTEITGKIRTMMEGTIVHQGLLMDVESWFEEAKNMGLDGTVDQELEEIVKSSDAVRTTIMKSLLQFGNATRKMIDLGNRVMQEAGSIIKENEDLAKKMSQQTKDKITIYDEHDLMVDQVKWEKAVKLILNTFEDALKWTKNATYKVTYTKAQQQFKNLSSAMSKKIVDLNGKQREVDDLKKKLFDAKTAVEKKHLEVEELKKNIRKISRNNEEQAKLIDTHEKRNEALNKKLAGTEQRMKSMEKEHLALEVAARQELEAKEAQLADALKPTPAPPASEPEVKKVVIKVLDPELVQNLKDAEDELERSKATISAMTEKIKDLERQIVREKEKIKILKEDLEKAEKEAEEIAMTVSNIPESTMEIPELIQEPGDKDSTYYKKILTGMKHDFSLELQKLRSHLEKEKQRGIAVIKKNEMAYKDHLTTIQKDVIRVLRAIMHFRDHICSVLEKENLKDPVFALQQLNSLLPDQLAPDPKDLLTFLVSNVVEYMHNMEVIIANAFLAMRMMIKGSVPQPYEQQQAEIKVKVKDAETRMKTMNTAKADSVSIAMRLKLAKEKLQKFEKITEDQAKDKRYMGLLDRYHMVWKMYNKLQKDMDILQGDFQNSIDEKIKEREQLVITNIKLDIKQRTALHEQELKMSISDQKENLKILEKAYDENRISKDLYMMSTAMIQKALTIPGTRLKYLFEQYIAFRSAKDARIRLQRILEDPELALDMRRDLEGYTRRMESKMHATMGHWHERIRTLEDDRRHLHKSIWKMFNEVLAETGVLLIHPLFQKNKETGQVYSQMAQVIKKEQLKKLLKRRHLTEMLKLPPVLLGSNMLSSLKSQQSLWKGVGEGEPMNPPALVDTPHSLHYDVNKPRINAERVIRNGDRGRAAYPLTKIQDYIIHPHLTVVV